MEFFSLLAISTALIVALALVLYRRTRDVGVLVGIGALYYWSLYGAWFILIDKSGGFSGKHYHYLEQKLFPIQLNSDYLVTLALYAGFILIVEVTLLAALSGQRAKPIPRLLLRHEPILLIGFLAGLGSVLIIGDKVAEAWTLNTSAYWYTRTDTDRWFTLHQVLNRVALIPPAIGFATLLAGSRSRFFVSVTRRYTVLGYATLFTGMGVFTFVLGNKNEVFVALLCGLLAYLASVPRPSFLRVGLAALGGLWFLYSIDFFRYAAVSDLSHVIEQRLGEATEVGRFVTSSNEAYAAHFSMYGVLSTDAEPLFGYSLYSLVCSIVPRVIWPDRPRDIYLYYSESVGAIQNQGYSIHHATGWYLSFGHLGVALGALVLGLVWAWCRNAHQRLRASDGLAFRIFATIAPWLFVACLPPLIRAGPEGYKGWILEGVLIPVITLLFSCRPKKLKKRLRWSAATGWRLELAR